MSLSDKLTQDPKDAVKQRDELRVSVIRMIRSQMKYSQIQQGTDFSSEHELMMLEKEAIEAYQQSGATTIKDIGKVMKPIMSEVRGRADGIVVQELVRGILST